MSLQLSYEEVRGLAKVLGELSNKTIPHTKILEAIAQTLGRPMDGMMHALKNAKSRAEANGCFADLIGLLPKDVNGLPIYADAAPILEQMVRYAPVDTKSAVLRLKIDGLDDVAKAADLAEAQVMKTLVGLFSKHLEHATIVGISEDELAILFTGVDWRYRIYDLLRGMERWLTNGIELRADEVRIIRFVGGLVLLERDAPYLDDSLEEMKEFIDDVMPSRHPDMIFAWNDSEGFDDF